MKFTHCSKIVRLALLILILFALAMPSLAKEKYEIKLEKRHEVVDCFVVYHNGKEIFSRGTDYGGFSQVAWSEGQKYFAIVDYAIKRGFVLYAYQVKGDEVTEVKLPDYRLNILGRYGKVKGGQYYGYRKLKWGKRAGEVLLTFEAYGSLFDEIGSSRLDDDDGVFYLFEVNVQIDESGRANLWKVKNLKDKKPEKPIEAEYENMIYIKAPVEKVWSMLVDKEEIEKASMLSLTKLELKKGGEICYAKGEVEGKIINFKKEEMLKHTSKLNVYRDEETSEICYTLQDIGGGITMLHVSQSGYTQGGITDGDVFLSWASTLSKMKTYLETGKSLR